MDISLVSCVLFVALCRFVGIVESIRSATERFRDIRFYRPSISLRWYILSRQNPGRPVSSDKNLSRGRTTRGRLADAPTVVPASICSTRAGSARSTALFLSIVPDDLTPAFGVPIDDDDDDSKPIVDDGDDERTSSSSTTTGAAAAAAAAGRVGSSPKNPNHLQKDLVFFSRAAARNTMNAKNTIIRSGFLENWIGKNIPIIKSLDF